MITIKTDKDIEKLKEGGKRLSAILNHLETIIKPGITPDYLNTEAEKMVAEYGDRSAFLNYKPEGVSIGYPSSLCVSINNEIVHGIAKGNNREIVEGDVVSIDMGLSHRELIVDSARTVVVGENKNSEKLLRATKEALEAGINEARAGSHTGDIGFAIQSIAKKYNLAIADGLAGHGVGYKVHEDPYIFNIGNRGEGEELKSGMVIAIEPMFIIGKGEIKQADDGFTYVSENGQNSAHFEHTVLITEDDPLVLTK